VKDLFREFKDFVNRGNLLDLAIAVVLATFFAPIISAIVDGVIMNLIAAIFGQPNFDSITIDVGDAELLIGSVITALVNFLIVALVCFFIVKGYNQLQRDQGQDAATPPEVELLTEIRDELRAGRT
jgi:large conductance mechanosensitive channel